jgi:hypothetical protein
MSSENINGIIKTFFHDTSRVLVDDREVQLNTFQFKYNVR